MTMEVFEGDKQKIKKSTINEKTGNVAMSGSRLKLKSQRSISFMLNLAIGRALKVKITLITYVTNPYLSGTRESRLLLS